MSGWFALVDTAHDDRLYPLVQQCAGHTCLISGKLDPAMAAVAPYLVAIDEHEPLIGVWREHGAGQHWGMLCEAELSLDALRKHLRRFLQAVLPDGTIAQFRFYDPRVFLTYLPAAPPAQQAQWFEGVRQYALEGADGQQHSLRLRGGRLYDGDAPLAA